MNLKESNRPTPEQEAVIAARDAKLVIIAAAGSGKTFTLVQRYLRYVLEDGLTPDEILTITFTRKAAAEMKSRIVGELQDRGLAEEAQIAETGPIQTIHGFCERLLRENALAAGLDPGFEILSESHYEALLDRAVQESLSGSKEDSVEAEKLIADLAGKGRFGSTSPYAQLQDAVKETVSQLRGAGLSIANVMEEFGDADRVLATWQSRVLSSSPREVREAFLTTHGSDPFVQRFKEAVLAAGLRLREQYRPFAAPPCEEADCSAAVHTAGLVQLACVAWRRLERDMERDQKLDFTALESRAIEVLSESREVARRVQARYRAVMVDEAQDINPLQYKLLQSLGLSSQLLVGDPQQSIYGFRQADTRLLKEHAATATRLHLSKNHRCDEGIIRFVDQLFSNLWGDDYSAMHVPMEPLDLELKPVPNYPGVELWEQENRDPNLTAMYIEQLLREGVAKKDIAVLVRKSRFGIQMQDALKGQGIESKIVGGSERFYTRLEIRDLANVLRALGDPYDDFAIAATLRSPIVGVSMECIASISKDGHIRDNLGAFQTCNEEDAASLDRFKSWFIPLSAYADRLAAWEALSEVLASSPYLTALAKRKDSGQLLANTRKLMSIACQEPELGPLEFAERVREIRELRHKEGDAPAIEETSDVVTIINVHKAKGLEFPVVVVPQTHDPLTRGPGDLEIDGRDGLISTNFLKQRSAFYNWMVEKRQERDRQEELRVLYVALTRAESRLCIVSHGSLPKDSIAKRVAAVFGWKRQPPVGFRIRTQADPEE